MTEPDLPATRRIRVVQPLPTGVERRREPREGMGASAWAAVLHGGTHIHCARIVDVSPLGIGLLLATPVPTGETLHLKLSSRRHAGGYTATLRVVHCTEMLPGNFVVGGEFTEPLSDGAMALLRS